MEDVVNAGTIRQQEIVCDSSDTLQYLEWTSVAGVQLAPNLVSKDCAILWRRHNQT
jgi:hypothetical protein